MIRLGGYIVSRVWGENCIIMLGILLSFCMDLLILTLRIPQVNWWKASRCLSGSKKPYWFKTARMWNLIRKRLTSPGWRQKKSIQRWLGKVSNYYFHFDSSYLCSSLMNIKTKNSNYKMAWCFVVWYFWVIIKYLKFEVTNYKNPKKYSRIQFQQKRVKIASLYWGFGFLFVWIF